MLFILAVFARSARAERVIDLSPFWSYRSIRAGNHHLVTPIIANVLAFTPIGLLLGCAFGKMKWWKVLSIGGGFSILIETLQFVLKRGHTEVDDVVHNVVGVMVVYN